MTVTLVSTPVELLEVLSTPTTVQAVISGSIGVVEIDTPPAVLVEIDAHGDQIIEVVTPGPVGPVGDTGATGAVGQTGPSPIYEQTFAVPLMQWVVHHTLNTHPVVTTVDTNGAEIIGDLSFPDNDTVIIDFGMPIAGIARLKG